MRRHNRSAPLTKQRVVDTVINDANVYSVMAHATAYLAGNSYLAMLTAVVPYILRVDMTDLAGNTAYAEYSSFVVGGAGTNYTILSLGVYSGTAGLLRVEELRRSAVPVAKWR